MAVTEYKMKWLFYGFLLGLIVTKVLPKVFYSIRSYTKHGSHIVGDTIVEEFDGKQRAWIHGDKNRLARYSQWPIFLTDPTFDLVGYSQIEIQ